MTVQFVTGRGPLPRQEIPGLQPELLAQGNLQDLQGLELVDRLFEEGDLGELQLFLRPEAPRAAVEQAIEELEGELRRRGALPWPGRERITVLDWENRTVRFFFQQGAPFLVVLLAVVLAAAGIIIQVGIVLEVLRRLGVQAPEQVDTVPEALAFLAVAAPLGLTLLRLLPLRVLVTGGLLLFLLVRPDLAWRAFRWGLRQAGRLLELLGVNPSALVLGAGAALVGGLLLLVGLNQAMAGGGRG